MLAISYYISAISACCYELQGLLDSYSTLLTSLDEFSTVCLLAAVAVTYCCYCCCRSGTKRPTCQRCPLST